MAGFESRQSTNWVKSLALRSGILQLARSLGILRSIYRVCRAKRSANERHVHGSRRTRREGGEGAARNLGPPFQEGLSDNHHAWGLSFDLLPASQQKHKQTRGRWV